MIQNQLQLSLSECLAQNKQVIPYFTCGDLSLAFTYELVCQTFEQGIDILELGIPFSDPIADGPVIQESHQRALAVKPDVSLDDAFSIVNTVKQRYPNKHIVFMSAVNLIMKYGSDRFFKRAEEVGLSGVIIPDLDLEHGSDYVTYAKQRDICLINLVSPLCQSDRLKRVVHSSSGFVYLISSLGITGERSSFSDQLESLTAAIKAIKPIPVGVGFGISQPDHIKAVHSYADAAIVGSHLVDLLDRYQSNPVEALRMVKDRLGKLMDRS